MTHTADGNGNGQRDAMIEVERLSRYYGPVPALKEVSFRAYRGEIVGFLGPNGAGKTTTMRILTGFMPPSGGTAWVAGYDVVEESMAARQATGYLPENTPLYTDMTVRGYLSFMARLRRVADRDEAVERVMDRVGIGNRADDLIAQLSKGLKQRVGIAQALVHDPEVVILDEPTIGLDPNQIREVQGLIRELGGGHTVILSTHILSEAEELCDRILIIREGEIVADDALERLAAHVQRGGQIVRVAVAATVGDADVEGVLRSATGVRSVTIEDDGAFAVEVDDADTAGPAIAAAVVGRGWPLTELTPVHLTLRDIYLQATAGLAPSDDTGGSEMDDDLVDEPVEDTIHDGKLDRGVDEAGEAGPDANAIGDADASVDIASGDDAESHGDEDEKGA